MTISIDFWQLVGVGITLSGGLFIATWALLHRMVFMPLDTIATELKDVKEVFGPRIAVLEAQVKQLQNGGK